MFRDPAGRASTSQVPDPAQRMGDDTRVAPDSPSAKDSDDMSVTNSEVESAMNQPRRRDALRDPGFSTEAFNAFNAADAYIRTARDGLARATSQYLKDMQVSLLCPNVIVMYQ